MQIDFVSDISTLDRAQWNSLFGGSYPFCQYDFLLALEQGASVNGNSGWQSQHLVVSQHGELIAAMPAYLKWHSYGEYLFDWQFADAYRHYNLPYYPKLLSAVPFTPAQGPRLGVAADYQHIDMLKLITEALIKRIDSSELSQFQCLYASDDDKAAFRQTGYQERIDVQFLWHNRGYLNFDDFLAQLMSRKRKQIRKERQAVTEQGIDIRVITGSDLTAAFWQQFYRFYRATYNKRSGHGGYLTLETFMRWGQSMASQIVVFAAFRQQDMVAAALCFTSADTLYGRYWGCNEDFSQLHFECCYYSGIQYCIEHKLPYFDAGAQGEHKLQRGFEPVLRSGFYYIKPTILGPAITDYIQREQQAVRQYQAEAATQLPYKISSSNAG
ncbi:MAG TPA: GNAT family N-acetyltransferase [Rheinheimera sp.]|uniref:GNAT family N-acetyltransferase n=1 Tax=Rheinheimera sp. TaxID=1869214 RepID=UPI002F941173